jgi:hypothetical protein
MGKLVNYGAGEMSDRLTVLALKLLFGTEAGRDVTHFRNEQVVLLTQIRGRTLNGTWFEAYTELAAVNAALWHAEDDLREMRKLDDRSLESLEVAALMAFRIQELNDRRAGLIEKINHDAGDGSGPEKLS